MKNKPFIIFTILTSFLMGCNNQREHEITTQKYEYIGNKISSWIKEGKLVSAELLITENGQPVFHKAYGDTKINSIWQIKSMTKPVTATAALILAEEGKLSLNDPVSKYIPEFAGDEQTTVSNLLNHTSGYDYMITGWEKGNYDHAEWITEVASQKPTKPFGEFNYSDFNMGALGYIVTLVSEQNVEQFTQERILQPLNMNNTYTWFTPDTSWASRVNDRYRWDEETKTNKVYWTHKEKHQWPFYHSAGGIYTTAKDYAKFMQSWLDKESLLSKDTIENQLVISQKNGYGGGWMISGPIFYHGGYDGTIAYAFPNNKIVILMAHSVGNTHKGEFSDLLQDFE